MTSPDSPQLPETGRLVGQSFTSPWVVVDQELVDRFAVATGDHQFIHVDPRRAAQTPLGGTIAHGFLLLSLLPQMYASAGVPAVPGLAMALNYGFDRVRFIAPVRTGTRVRANFTVASLTQRRPGEWLQDLAVSLEADGMPARPVLVAQWLSLLVLAAGTDAHPAVGT